MPPEISKQARYGCVGIQFLQSRVFGASLTSRAQVNKVLVGRPNQNWSSSTALDFAFDMIHCIFSAYFSKNITDHSINVYSVLLNSRYDLGISWLFD